MSVFMLRSAFVRFWEHRSRGEQFSLQSEHTQFQTIRRGAGLSTAGYCNKVLRIGDNMLFISCMTWGTTIRNVMEIKEKVDAVYIIEAVLGWVRLRFVLNAALN